MSKSTALLLAAVAVIATQAQAAAVAKRQADGAIAGNETAINENVLRRNW